MAAPAPWDVVPSKDQLFVLVTGANSGIGLGIAQLLMDDFAVQRSAASHLTVIVTTRSPAKSRATVDVLREHLRNPNRRASSASARIHLSSVELDLCRLPTVYAAAQQLTAGTLAMFTGGGPTGRSTVVQARVPRLDAVIFNAGIGGWTGFSWVGITKQVLTDGLKQATSYPLFKMATPGLLVDPLTGRQVSAADAGADLDHLLGEVFCANVFGHYLLAHALLPLLRRPAGATLPPARIVWESSVDAMRWEALSLDDLQGVRTDAPYESSKRLTDVLSLTSELPGVRRVAAPFVGAEEDDKAVPPRQYVTHPGIVCSTLFPVPLLFFQLYHIVLYVARWLGSPWHVVSAYKGATAAVWVALQPADALDAAEATRIKWGASATRGGRALVKKTEVEGWGWEGAPEQPADDNVSAYGAHGHVLCKAVGRRKGVIDTTAEQRQEFEDVGRTCWQEMEQLRHKWESRLAAVDGKDGKGKQ